MSERATEPSDSSTGCPRCQAPVGLPISATIVPNEPSALKFEFYCQRCRHEWSAVIKSS